MNDVLELEDQTVIGCLGLSSKYVFNDEKVYGKRGHLIEMENTAGLKGVYGFPNSVDLYCFEEKILIGFSSDEYEKV